MGNQWADEMAQARWNEAEKGMQIFVTNVHTGRKLTIEVEGDDTVDKLKEKVEKEGEKVKNDSFIIRPALQRLISHNSVVMLGGIVVV